jgi:hypothetical protein
MTYHVPILPEDALTAPSARKRGGFNKKVPCPSCGRSMSAANLAQHYQRCVDSHSKALCGQRLSIRQFQKLRNILSPTGLSVAEYVSIHERVAKNCLNQTWAAAA